MPTGRDGPELLVVDLPLRHEEEELVQAHERRHQDEAETEDPRADAAVLRARFESLSERGREVLDGLAAGKLNKQVAADLGIVEQTVKFHRSRIMRHFAANSAAELMLIAAKLGLGRERGR